MSLLVRLGLTSFKLEIIIIIISPHVHASLRYSLHMIVCNTRTVTSPRSARRCKLGSSLSTPAVQFQESLFHDRIGLPRSLTRLCANVHSQNRATIIEQAVDLNPVFYGRRAEVQLLTNTLLSSPGEILVLLGPPGCGKTALLRSVQRALRSSGCLRSTYIDTSRYDMSHTSSLARELVVESAHWFVADLDRLSGGSDGGSGGNLLYRMLANATNAVGRQAIWSSPLLRRLERAVFRSGDSGAAAAALARLSSFKSVVSSSEDEQVYDELTVIASNVLDLEGKPVELNDVLRLYDELLSRPPPPAAAVRDTPTVAGNTIHGTFRGGGGMRTAFIIDGAEALRHCLSLRQRRAQPLVAAAAAAGTAAGAAAAAMLPADRETGALLRFLVRECCQERRARAVLVTNDSTFVEWLGDAIGYYNFRTEVLGDLPLEEVPGFLSHLRPSLSKGDLSPHRVDRIFEVCGGNPRSLVRWAAEYRGDLDAALYAVAKDVGSHVRQALSSPPAGTWTRKHFKTVIRCLAGSTASASAPAPSPSTRSSCGASTRGDAQNPRGDEGLSRSEPQPAAQGQTPGDFRRRISAGGADLTTFPGTVLQEDLEALLGPGGPEAVQALLAARLLSLRPAYSDWARDVPAAAWLGRLEAPLVMAASPLHLHAMRRLAAELEAADAAARDVAGPVPQDSSRAAGLTDGGEAASSSSSSIAAKGSQSKDDTVPIGDAIAAAAEAAAGDGATAAGPAAVDGFGSEGEAGERDVMLREDMQELADTWWEVASALQEVEDAVAAVRESQPEGWEQQLAGLWSSKEELQQEQQQLLARQSQDSG